MPASRGRQYITHNGTKPHKIRMGVAFYSKSIYILIRVRG
nr:MAG TPA: hypothetical protein [Caudoviricetes sp.]